MSTDTDLWRDAPLLPTASPWATEPPPRPDGREGGALGRVAAALGRSRGRVGSADQMLLMRHLSTLLSAGLQLSKALRTVARQMAGTRLAAIVTTLADEVSAGEMLSSAMACRGPIFDSLTINVVRAGEAGGTLPETLTELANDMEQKQTLRRNVVGALVYPAIVIAIAAAVIGFVLVYVVPVFEDVYTKMKLELPWITRLLLASSRLLLGYWWALALAGVAAGIGLHWARTAERTRRAWDDLMLRLPLFGALRRKALAARFLGAFATLIRSGVSIVETLHLMGRLVDNAIVCDAIGEIERHVTRGGRMSESMERHAYLFPPMASQMIGVGEQTGTLPEAAARTAEFLAEEVQTRIHALTVLLEPLLTVGLGLVVGAIALAIYLPLFDLMKHVSN